MKKAGTLADILRKFNVYVSWLIFPQYVIFLSPSAFYFPFITVIPLPVLKIFMVRFLEE